MGPARWLPPGATFAFSRRGAGACSGGGRWPGPARPGEFLRDGEVRCCPSSRRPPGLALRRPGSFSSKSRCGFYFSFSLYTVSLQNAVDCDLEQANVT